MDLTQLHNLMAQLESQDPKLNVHQLRFLLYVFIRHEKTGTPLPLVQAIKDTGMTKAGVSRICSYFGDRKANSGVPGLQLLKRVEDSYDTRTKNIVLTTRGKALLSTLKGA